MTHDILSSWNGKLTGTFDPKTGMIIFQGGRHGEHSLYYESDADAERVIAHWDGYCSNNGMYPNYRGWRREKVISMLAFCIRQIKEGEDALHRTG